MQSPPRAKASTCSWEPKGFTWAFRKLCSVYCGAPRGRMKLLVVTMLWAPTTGRAA